MASAIIGVQYSNPTGSLADWIYSESDAVGVWSDVGIVSSKRRLRYISSGSVETNLSAQIAYTLTGLVIGHIYKITASVIQTQNGGAFGGELLMKVDGVQVATTSNVFGSQVDLVAYVTAAATTAVLVFYKQESDYGPGVDNTYDIFNIVLDAGLGIETTQAAYTLTGEASLFSIAHAYTLALAQAAYTLSTQAVVFLGAAWTTTQRHTTTFTKQTKH